MRFICHYNQLSFRTKTFEAREFLCFKNFLRFFTFLIGKPWRHYWAAYFRTKKKVSFGGAGKCAEVLLKYFQIKTKVKILIKCHGILQIKYAFCCPVIACLLPLVLRLECGNSSRLADIYV
jgi:hypothetical protein